MTPEGSAHVEGEPRGDITGICYIFGLNTRSKQLQSSSRLSLRGLELQSLNPARSRAVDPEIKLHIYSNWAETP